MSTDNVKEAHRVMTICNSCRYCEGFCAVFPAMELRRTFTEGELKYLANLCHNCRDCYYACQFAPPHEFDLNFPQAMADLRVETYSEFAWPRFFSGLFQKNGMTVVMTTLASLALVFFTTVAATGKTAIFTAQSGPGSFYQVIPYSLMLIPFILLGIAVLISLVNGGIRYCRKTDIQPGTYTNISAYLGAISDVLKLKYLEGGGFGCNYPDDEFSTIRRTMHHFVFYGFLLCLASTTVAAIYDHILHIQAPYPVFSLPVILGTIGGLSMVVGLVGLLYLKLVMDRRPATSNTSGMDIGFLALLLLTVISGLLLLVFRQTSLMGVLLITHIGFVLALFITMPFGKFVHAVYRYLALVRHNREQRVAADE